MIRVLIADDEPLARDILKQMLAAHTDVEVVGESGSGTTAVADIQRLRPDLLLLDVQMPGLDGFGVLRELRHDPNPPYVIFVTAYDQHAVRAFEVRAVDYLLKPFDERRLAVALERTRTLLDRGVTNEEVRRLIDLLDEFTRSGSYSDRIPVRSGKKVVLLPCAQIDLVEAEGKNVSVVAGSETYTMRSTLSSIDQMLDPRHFLRVSRSTIVNSSRIREIHHWARGEYLLILENGRRIPTTRLYRQNVDRMLNSSD